MSTDKSVLITVGTTGFDDLIRVVCSEPLAREMAIFGYRSIYIQYGSSKDYFSDLYFKEKDVYFNFPYYNLDYCSGI